ncbi:MAG TPA: Lrp/AsnC family transcriptional regulator [Thermoleophilia bacterium]|nr:Lrp/AsnC family transcriptional regulator [Thermoleophilia bacterium]HQG02902.1 Lrp/AsnC family transcriptional regulator [Thermoleophilia bacterium]HQG54974.1 Lrp/AsnC family transcriptional regulator [Thermoleophilia bacterium]HQJ98779.1 Lrp/AsnC family transcriptional regulator [Thermoleophilia bacterium]
MRGRGLDSIDARIITHLQEDGRRPYTAIAKDVGISEASVRQRVSRLLRRNVIQIVAASSPLDLGLLSAQIHIRVAGDKLRQTAEALAALPEVDFVGICAGRFDLTVGVVCRDREALYDLLVNRIRPIPGIVEAELLLMLEVLKDNYQWSPATDAPGA